MANVWDAKVDTNSVPKANALWPKWTRTANNSVSDYARYVHNDSTSTPIGNACLCRICVGLTTQTMVNVHLVILVTFSVRGTVFEKVTILSVFLLDHKGIVSNALISLCPIHKGNVNMPKGDVLLDGM